MLEKTIKDLELEINYKKIDFFEINVDSEKLWSDQKNDFFKIMRVPTIIIFNGQEEKNRFLEYKDSYFLKEELKKIK